MSGTPEWLKAHRELEYLRSVARVPKKAGKKQKEARQRVKQRYRKHREVNYDD